MDFIKRLLGPKQPAAPAPSSLQPQSQFMSGMSGMSQQHAAQGTNRRELLRVVLRDTLQRQGIPSDWIGAELLTVTSRDGQKCIHWRLLIKHWDPRLLTCAVALQQALIKRVMTFDPVASTWLHGISWQFMIEDESVCPPLPHPGSWTSAPAQPAAAQPAAAQAATGGVIEGPVRIGAAGNAKAHQGDAKADLDALLAIRDADFVQHASNRTWSRTEPAKL